MRARERRQRLESLWYGAVESVGGKKAVLSALDRTPVETPSTILAVGKAASGMAEGALQRFPGTPALVTTKYGHTTPTLLSLDSVEVIESAHPVPDQNSLRAGNCLIARMRSQRASDHVLLLVSGGASALAEALPPDKSLVDLQALNSDMLATGLAIGEINARRKELSLIKGGKLVAYSNAMVTVLAISDVEGDSIATIGSGIGDPAHAPDRATARIIASNAIARARVAELAASQHIDVIENSETLYGDVNTLAGVLGNRLNQARPGLYIWGGEPTVVLPDEPGRGGRNQALALALSEHITDRHNCSVLVAGTDGSDGPTTDAGGIVDGSTWCGEARDALERADAGSLLASRGALFSSGPTHTNVMDLAIALVE